MESLDQPVTKYLLLKLGGQIRPLKSSDVCTWGEVSYVRG